MVVNKDTRREKTGAELTMRVVLSFHPSVQSVQCLRRNSGKVETIAVGKYYAFELSGGTGDLFRFEGSITASSAFVGLEPVERRAWSVAILPTVASLDGSRTTMSFNAHSIAMPETCAHRFGG